MLVTSSGCDSVWLVRSQYGLNDPQAMFSGHGLEIRRGARRHGLAPSVVFTWRRLAREGRLGEAGPSFMPVEITPVPAQVASAASPPRRIGLIEIVLGRGRRIRVDRDVDAEALRRVLQVVESL